LELSDQLKEAIVSYYDGKLTQSQAEELLTWVNQSNENLDHFREMGSLWHATAILDTTGFDSQPALDSATRILRKRSNRPVPERVIRLRITTLIRTAAAIALICLAGATVLWLQHRNRQAARPALFVETSAPKGSRSFITLPDGTTVWLNAGTRFRYPVDYGVAERKVYLDGEAYFKVSKNKKLPFRVFTSDITVTALGTAFNVKAYEDEGTIETTLEEGLVRIDELHAGKQGGAVEPIVLKPKQSAVFHKDRGNLAISETQAAAAHPSVPQRERLSALPINVKNVADTRLYTSWKDSRWIFKNEKLSSLVVKLERRYDVDIVFMDKALENYAFTGTLQEESLEQVLSAIRYTAPIRYEVHAKQVELYEDKDYLNQYKGITNQ
jgi:ferric-dicitrate binding protein FerR (iron transport regulator)